MGEQHVDIGERAGAVPIDQRRDRAFHHIHGGFVAALVMATVRRAEHDVLRHPLRTRNCVKYSVPTGSPGR